MENYGEKKRKRKRNTMPLTKMGSFLGCHLQVTGQRVASIVRNRQTASGRKSALPASKEGQEERSTFMDHVLFLPFVDLSDFDKCK